jgi:hypothetical protein
MHTGFWWRNVKGKRTFKDLSVDGRISKWIIKKWDGKALIWLMIGGKLRPL